MVSGGNDGNAHWVRTRDERSAKLFMAEQEMLIAAEAERIERSRAFRRRIWNKMRALLHRS